MQQVGRLKINEFFSIASQLAIKAAHIIKEVIDGKDFQKKMKDIDDPMTIADLKAQTMIIQGIKRYWPNLNIIGEEQTSYEGEIDLSNLNPNLYPSSLFSRNKNNLEIETELEINEQLTVWVDPLDGTLSYVNGEFDAVTTLIGLSVGTQAVLGVIGIPYPHKQDQEGKFNFDPKVYFGNCNQGKVFYAYEKDTLKQENYIPYELVRPSLKLKPKYNVCCSKNRITKEQENNIKGLDPEQVIKIGGSGKKTLLVLEGESDLYIYIGKKTKKWDTCPGEALVRAMGGSFVGFDGKPYSYYPPDSVNLEEQYGNMNGLLVSLYTGDVFQRWVHQSKGFL